MSTFAALHWNDRRLRVALASIANGSVRVEQILTRDLSGASADAEVRQHLEAIASEHHLKGLDVVVVIDREQFELRQIDVPPAPDDELPDMVRFQARSSFSSFGDADVVDFIRLANGAENVPLQLLAATLSAAELKKIQAVVEPSRLKLKHVLPRQFASVNLVQSVLADGKYQLLVNDFGDDVDLSVTYRNRIVLTRTVRLSHGDSERATQLIREIRRTIAALQNQQKGGSISKILILGERSQHQKLADDIVREVDLGCETLRTAGFVSIAQTALEPLTDDDGSLAPLLGALGVGGEPAADLIDFMAPRRRPVSKHDPRKLYYIGGGLAAALAICLLIALVMFAQRRSQIAGLQKQLDELNQATKDAKALIADVDLIDQWKRGDINWLDELSEISSRYPLPDISLAKTFHGSMVPVLNEPTGQITIEGLVTNQIDEGKMEESLRGRPYMVRPGTVGPLPSDVRDYANSYSLTLKVDLQSRDIDKLVPNLSTAEKAPTDKDNAPASSDPSDSKSSQ